MQPRFTTSGLFNEMISAYAKDEEGVLDNTALYAAIAAGMKGQENRMDQRVPIGRDGIPRSPQKRKVRWYQQTLKNMGILERVPGERGVWRLTEKVGKDLHRAANRITMVAFSTDLGVAIWGNHEDVFRSLDEPIALCVTSPPYPLRKARAYGGPEEQNYADFICTALEPIVHNLIPGGSIVLNVSNDIFEPNQPSRSLYLERMVIALHDRLGLALMDRIPWVNYSKPPGPTYWSCINRVQLSAAYEPIFWFTNDPGQVRSDNRRVLEAHTAQHRKLMQSGGERRVRAYGDGAYRLRKGSFATETPGRIPRNVIEKGHSCPDTRIYRKLARSMDLPVHGAMQPTSIPDFFIRLLTEPDELIVDPFGGVVKTGLAAERQGRRWLVTEWIWEYLKGSAAMFEALRMAGSA
ncbi:MULTISPECIES: DNA methyltransferase [Acidithiobacillus]|uniref:DNA methyltransferase n=1 Tax=Acidithiobacillus TaxID=119977 RepID=UPI0004E1AE70|nr:MULTISPECIES: DNA methyltransferase [Acidithiobacillus]MDD2750722.1 DNA methyltransferase [Acidithiobacillus sp.]MDD5278616.1 DNA methyltransferase [Acidithiobacillus sp.]